MKKIALLGATGSIGVRTLEVVRAHPDQYAIVALSAGRNAALLLEQIASFRPLAVAVLEPSVAAQVASRLPKEDAPQILVGMDGFDPVASLTWESL